MLDARKIRANPEEVAKQLEKRNLKGVLDQFLLLDEKRRAILGQAGRKNEKAGAGPGRVNGESAPGQSGNKSTGREPQSSGARNRENTSQPA